jgi:hypothetical protein
MSNSLAQATGQSMPRARRIKQIAQLLKVSSSASDSRQKAHPHSS